MFSVFTSVRHANARFSDPSTRPDPPATANPNGIYARSNDNTIRSIAQRVRTLCSLYRSGGILTSSPQVPCPAADFPYGDRTRVTLPWSGYRSVTVVLRLRVRVRHTDTPDYPSDRGITDRSGAQPPEDHQHRYGSKGRNPCGQAASGAVNESPSGVFGQERIALSGYTDGIDAA
jgi:hypothetical protein